MRLESLVIDNFYSNPDIVRDFALSQEFSVKGNYPGSRTKSFLTPDVKELIQLAIEPLAGKVTNWNDDSYSGAFQLTTCFDRTWIHADTFNTWAGVLYLTPNAPLSGGTGLFKHKKTDQYGGENDKNGHDYTEWDLVDRFANKYNRLIMYRADLYHASLDYFGTSNADGRLFQVFFLNTER